MKIETLKKSQLKKNIIIGMGLILIISAVVLNFTRAKYRVTQSIPLVNGTINYTPYDFKIIAMYQENDNGDYINIDKVPISGYILNETKSYCEANGEKDNNIKIEYTKGQINFLGMTTEGTKCYLYFDEKNEKTMSEIIAGYNTGSRENFNNVYTTETTNFVFTTTDWTNNTTYYFAGNPTDNWVQFGGFYWRIIRINGDGSIRIIYNGTSTTTTGTDTMINSSQPFNSSYDRSEYVGLKYTLNSQRGQNEDSPILDNLQSWYTSSGLSTTKYAQYIDSNIGFCSNRNVASGYSWSSQPTGYLYYEAYEKLYTNKQPSLSCNNNDIIKEPVGLITADEVAFAGGVYGTKNTNYYLYNQQNYWTMTPSHFSCSSSRAYLFRVYSDGSISYYLAFDKYGVRPVINLRSDTTFTGDGTATNPYVVS